MDGESMMAFMKEMKNTQCVFVAVVYMICVLVFQFVCLFVCFCVFLLISQSQEERWTKSQ